MNNHLLQQTQNEEANRIKSNQISNKLEHQVQQLTSVRYKHFSVYASILLIV